MKHLLRRLGEPKRGTIAVLIFAVSLVLSAGIYWLTPKDIGAAESSQVSNFLLNGQSSINVKLTRGQGCTVSGMLTDNSGNPIAGEPVHLQYENPSGNWVDEGAMDPLTSSSGVASFTWNTDGSNIETDYRLYFPGSTAYNPDASNIIGVTFDNTPPIINISHNPSGATVPPGPVTITVGAYDLDSGIKSIVILESVDGAPYAIIETCSFNSPYPFTPPNCESTKTYSAGDTVDYYAYVLTASACNQFTTLVGGFPPPQNKFTVSGGAPALTVSITSPTAGTLVSGIVTISATASAGANRVEFFVDGVRKGEDALGPSPFTFPWDTTNAGTHACGPHQHTLTARAHDASGNTANSASVSVNMNNPPGSGCPVTPGPTPPGPTPPGPTPPGPTPPGPTPPGPTPPGPTPPGPTPPGPTSPPGTIVIFNVTFPNPLRATTVEELISAIINFLTFIIIPIAILLILYAAFRYMIMGAIPLERQKAIKIIQFALAGIVVVLLAQVIKAIVEAVLT